MITAVIDAGQHYCQAVSDLWQWDYGQTLRIQGVKLPAADRRNSHQDWCDERGGY